MFVLTLSCTEDEFYAMACQAKVQLQKTVEREQQGKPHGQNLNATHHELEKFENWFPDEVQKKLDRLIASISEGNKP